MSLTKEQLTDAHEQGLSIRIKNGNIKIVAILGDVYGINHFNSNKVQWWMFEQFEEQEATIEYPKQKIDLSILKEGSIYYAKGISSYEYIFMLDKLVNNRIMVQKGYTITDKYETCEFLAIVKQLTELRLPTESELELFYSKFPDLKPKPKYNGRAVKCDTVEQANWLFKKEYPNSKNIHNSRPCQLICIYLTHQGWDYEKEAIENNYEIISFSQYCQENNLTEPKWIQGFEVKDGYNDVVMVSDNLKSWHINILQSVNNGLQPFNCGFHSWKHCRYLNKNEINEIKFVD